MIEIYNSGTQQSSGFDRSKEICKNCATKERQNGHYIEFDRHLYKYVDEVDGVSKYLSGDDDIKDKEIVCSMCSNSFITDSSDILTDS